MKKSVRTVFILLSLLIGLQAQATAPVCNTVHATKAQAQVRYIERDGLVAALLANQIPAVAIPTAKGPIPAILMNAETAPHLTNLLDRSLGTIVNYQPEYNNDHGMIRLFQVLADMDTPGARRAGELHQTGISWTGLNSYLQYAQGRSRVKVEVVYSLTPEEARAAKTYHLMRRAAIVRVPFTFGGRNRQVGLMNLLERSGEHCFVFCSGSGVSGQIQEIRQVFTKYNLGTIDEVIAREDVKMWIKAVEDKLNQTSASDGHSLNATLPLRVGIPESLKEATSQMTPETRAEMLNWLAGYSISQSYLGLTRTLGIQGDTAYNGIQNPRAVAVFIYDGVASAEQFMSPEYTALGKFSNWSHQNSKPLAEAFPEAVRVLEEMRKNPQPAAEDSPVAPPKKKGFLQKILNLFQ